MKQFTGLNRTYNDVVGASRIASCKTPGDMKGVMRAADAGERQACPEGFVPHIIRRGESLVIIAEKYGMTLTELMEYNPNINPYFYTTGQVLCVPATAMQPGCENGTLYTIAQGDTLYSISQRFGAAINAIMLANPGLSPQSLVIGRIICVPAIGPGNYYGPTAPTGAPGPEPEPQPTPTPPPPPEPEPEPQPEPEPEPLPEPCPFEDSARYIVVQGDTLLSLLTRFNISYRALSVSNPDMSLQDLEPGMSLCVPPPGTRGSCAASLAAYKMDPVETLASVAARFGVDETTILLLNPILTPLDFACEQVICVPQAGA